MNPSIREVDATDSRASSIGMTNRYLNRTDAGRELTARLAKYRRDPSVIVLGLPRGGVPVACEVARALCAPIDVLIVRKLGVPGREEYAMGAIASGGFRVVNPDAAMLSIADTVVDQVVERETRELERRERYYRGGRAPPSLRDRTVILVDDGLATGSTMRAALRAVREQEPARIVVAVPVGSRDSCDELSAEADEVVCAMTPHPFWGVSAWYEDFGQTSDGEVHALIESMLEASGRAADSTTIA